MPLEGAPGGVGIPFLVLTGQSLTLLPPLLPGGMPLGAIFIEQSGGPQGDGRVQLATQSEDDDHPLAQIKLWIASSDVANFNPGVRTYKAKGSFAAPVILDNGNTMGSWEARGYVQPGAGPDGDGYITQSYFVFQTTEAWVAGVAHGCGFFISGTINGTTAVVPLLNVSGSQVQVLGSGLIQLGSNVITGRVAINGAAGSDRKYQWFTAGLLRWELLATNTAESGGNAGSPLRLNAYDDAGAFIDAPLIILRAAGGVVTFARPMLYTSFSDIDEIAEPANAAANRGRLFMKDNGAGKTQFCVRFSTGATIVIATEP